MSGTNDTNNIDNVVEAAKMAEKAKQTMNQVSGAMPAEAKSAIQSAKEHIWDSDELRSLSMFFGIGESNTFSIAINPTILCPRLKNNLFFFYLNYILLTAIVFCVILLATVLNPTSLIMLGALGLGWFVVLQATSEGSATMGPIEVSRKVACGIMVIISLFVAFFLVKDIFFVTIGSGVCLSFVHALLRDATPHYEQMKSKTTSKALVQDLHDCETEEPYVHINP